MLMDILLQISTLLENRGLWIGALGFLHLLLFLAVAYHCLQNRRPATSALLWIFIAWTLPALGALFYLAFGINRLPVKGWLKHQADQELLSERQKIAEGEAPELVYWRAVHNQFMTEPPSDFAKTLNNAMDASLKEYPLLGGNDIKPLLNGDEAYPAMLEAIRQAENHVNLVSFIIKNDNTGREFMDLLADKAREGCEIRLIYDRYGSSTAVFSGLFRKYKAVPNFEILSWTQANVLKRQLQYNLRNHRKLLVVDGKQAFVGGINISDTNVTRNNIPPFEDFHFQVSGPVVQELQYTFLRDWHFMTRESAANLLHQRFFPELPAKGSAAVRIVNSGPTAGEMQIISDVVFSCIVSARRDILAVTPYFVPGDALLQAIRIAALRGVRTRLIVPQKNNHTIAGWAARARYEDLLEAGVEIYERRSPFIHAKALTVDDEVALIGTANLDERSLRLNYETNLSVYDQGFIAELKQLLVYELSQSNKVSLAAWLDRSRQQRILENFCNLFSPVL